MTEEWAFTGTDRTVVLGENAACAESCCPDWMHSLGQVVEPSTSNGLRAYKDVEEKLLEGDVEAMLKGEMGRLSIEEREKVYHDLHGISNPPEEVEDVLHGLLLDMDVELSLISEKEAYTKAESMVPDYVKDRKLRLMFLRADNYDPCKAAHRFVSWLAMKVDLFGEDLLCREIKVQDLCADGQESLKGGFLQMLPTRDVAGRIVVMDMLRWYNDVFISTPGMLQMFFYMAMVILQNEDTQRSGAVCVFLAHHWKVNLASSHRELYWKGAKMTGILPIKFHGFHFCCDPNVSIRPLLNILQLGMPRDIRHRFKIHIGSETECMYAIMGYGIPVHLVPVTDAGDLALTNHSKWIERRKAAERKKQPVVVSDGSSVDTSTGCKDDDTIELPSQYDILCGRGRPFQDHYGNRFLRQAIADKFEEFDNAARSEKTAMTESIVRLVHSKKGRFLKKDPQDPTVWKEVSFKESREKVAHGFRKHREMLQSAKSKAIVKENESGKRMRSNASDKQRVA